jgi:hypothetical protein
MVIDEYHAFLGATVQFLHEIQERQMKWRWDAQSGVRDELSWLQSLWASRSSVSLLYSHSFTCYPFLITIVELGKRRKWGNS